MRFCVSRRAIWKRQEVRVRRRDAGRRFLDCLICVLYRHGFHGVALDQRWRPTTMIAKAPPTSVRSLLNWLYNGRISQSNTYIDPSTSRFGLARLFAAVAIAAVAAWFLRLSAMELGSEDSDILKASVFGHLALVLLAVALGYLYRKAAILAIAGLWLLITGVISVPWFLLEWSLLRSGGS